MQPVRTPPGQHAAALPQRAVRNREHRPPLRRAGARSSLPRTCHRHRIPLPSHPFAVPTTEQEIYTWTSRILVAVNPYETVRHLHRHLHLRPHPPHPPNPPHPPHAPHAGALALPLSTLPPTLPPLAPTPSHPALSHAHTHSCAPSPPGPYPLPAAWVGLGLGLGLGLTVTVTVTLALALAL